MEEKWLPIKGYEGLYEISSLGNVKVLPKYKSVNYSVYVPETIKKPTLCKNGKGYWCVHLCKNNKKTTFRNHRLVAFHFIDNPLNLPQVNHINGDTRNNNVDNLEWCSALQNIQHAWRIGLTKCIGKDHPKSRSVIQMDLDGNEIKTWESACGAQRFLGVKFNTNIGNCCIGKRETAYGYKWKYAV